MQMVRNYVSFHVFIQSVSGTENRNIDLFTSGGLLSTFLQNMQTLYLFSITNSLRFQLFSAKNTITCMWKWMWTQFNTTSNYDKNIVHPIHLFMQSVRSAPRRRWVVHRNLSRAYVREPRLGSCWSDAHSRPVSIALTIAHFWHVLIYVHAITRLVRIPRKCSAHSHTISTVASGNEHDYRQQQNKKWLLHRSPPRTTLMPRGGNAFVSSFAQSVIDRSINTHRHIRTERTGEWNEK